MNRKIGILICIIVITFISHSSESAPLGSGFTYRGHLDMAGIPVTASLTMRFSLWDFAGTGNPPEGGTQVGNTQTISGVIAANGQFTVLLNDGDEFGNNAFNGNARWIQIEICEDPACTAPVTLSPRQPLTAVPFAGFANSSDWSGLVGIPAPFADGIDNSGDPIWGENGRDIFFTGGLVGIGTTVATAKLDVVDGRIRVRDSATNNRWDLLYDANTTNLIIQENAASTHFVITGGGPSGGRVGIGTSTPASRLTVAGKGAELAISGNAQSGGIGVSGTASGGANARGLYGSVGPGGYCGTSGDHSGSGNYGLLGTANEGVFANAVVGNAVRGVANGGIGLWGSSNSNAGVYGTSGTSNGVSGGSTSGSGIYGLSQSGVGVNGFSSLNIGVTGTSTNAAGVEGSSTSGPGLSGYSVDQYGLYARSGGGSNSAAVYAEGSQTGWGLIVKGPSEITGEVYLYGNVRVGGDLSVEGEILKPSEKIDHPLDPANKYLQHSPVHSPDMMNIYNGIVTTDAEGYASVALPDYFDALNRDFRYQLTVLDETDSDEYVLAKVVRKIKNKQFTIRTSSPGVEVSWQVTGIRQDPWANEHRILAEQDKPEGERGRYLAPELYGHPEEKGIGHQVGAAIRKAESK